MFARSDHWKIIFNKEKIFTFKKKIYQQNYCVYAKNFHLLREKILWVQGSHHPSSVIVWWCLLYIGVTLLYFWKKRARTSSNAYWGTLYAVINPLNISLFHGKNWSFNQILLQLISENVAEVVTRKFAGFYCCRRLDIRKLQPQPTGLFPMASVRRDRLQKITPKCELTEAVSCQSSSHWKKYVRRWKHNETKHHFE